MKAITLSKTKSFIKNAAGAAGSYSSVNDDVVSINSANCFLSFQGDEKVKFYLSLDDNKGNNLFKGRGADLEELHKSAKTKTIDIDLQKLNYVSLAMAVKDVRYYLNGVAIYKDGLIAATDGHRAHFYGDITHNTVTENALIIPRHIVSIMLSIAKKGVVSLVLPDVFGETDSASFVAFFEVAGVRCFFRLGDGRYPDIARIVPSRNLDKHINKAVDKKTLLSFFDAAKITDPKHHTIVATKTGEPLFYSEKTKGYEKTTALFDGVVLSVEAEKGLNAGYLRDALSHGEPFVSACNNKSTSSLLISAGDLRAVVMPVRF